jgi:hypothetical protein
MRHLLAAFFALLLSFHSHSSRPFDMPSPEGELSALRVSQHPPVAHDPGNVYAEAACRTCRLTTASSHVR